MASMYMYIAASYFPCGPQLSYVHVNTYGWYSSYMMTLVTRLEWVLTIMFLIQSHAWPGSETTLCAFVCHSRQELL